MPDQMELSPEVEEKATAVASAAVEARRRAEAMQVTNDEEASAAAALLRDVATRRKTAEKERTSLKAPILEAGRRLDARFKEVMEPFDAVDEVLRGKLGTYQREQEQKRLAEQKRLEDERLAREAAEREAREKAEAEEKKRREQAEADAREAEKLAQEARDEEERAQAEELREQSEREAEEARQRQEAIATAPPPAPLPKAEVEPAAAPTGVQMKKVWKATVVDVGAVPREYLEVDEVKIRAAVRAGVREIPGVRIEQVDQMAVRG